MNDMFVNLHVHTLYSKQDSIIKIEDLVSKVKEFGQTSCAVTDHSSTAAYYLFKQECLKQGIKPIYGNEFYLNKNYEEKSRNRDHLVMLAMNDEGLKNINRMQDIAVHHSYYKPILSYDIISDYSYGVYCTSACSLGIIPKLILEKNIDEAWDWCDKFMEWFDGNFALELQLHPNYPEQVIINKGLIRLNDLTGIPLTVSTDAHFIDESVRDVRRIIQAISWHKQYDEVQDSLKSNCLGSTQLVLGFAKEMNVDLNIVSKAIEQTNKIANLCDADLCSEDRKVPIFDKFHEFDKLFNEVM